MLLNVFNITAIISMNKNFSPRSMEQYDIRWFEEPVVPEDLEVMVMYVVSEMILCISRSDSKKNKF